MVAYQLMGVGALSLVQTHLVLARKIARHTSPGVAPAWQPPTG